MPCQQTPQLQQGKRVGVFKDDMYVELRIVGMPHDTATQSSPHKNNTGRLVVDQVGLFAPQLTRPQCPRSQLGRCCGSQQHTGWRCDRCCSDFHHSHHTRTGLLGLPHHTLNLTGQPLT